MYVWGGDIEIGARSCWALCVFVWVLSNINIIWQKSLNAPLNSNLLFMLSVMLTFKLRDIPVLTRSLLTQEQKKSDQSNM